MHLNAVLKLCGFWLEDGSAICQRDVQTLVLQYPLESIHGNGGGIRLADWYHPHRNILSQEQIRTLRELSSYADEQQKKIVQQIISAYGTNTYCSVWKTKE